MTSEKVTLVLRSLVSILKSPNMHSMLETCTDDKLDISVSGTLVHMKKKDTLIVNNSVMDRIVTASFFNDMLVANVKFENKTLVPNINVDIVMDSKSLKSMTYNVNTGMLV